MKDNNQRGQKFQAVSNLNILEQLERTALRALCWSLCFKTFVLKVFLEFDCSKRYESSHVSNLLMTHIPNSETKYGHVSSTCVKTSYLGQPSERSFLDRICLSRVWLPFSTSDNRNIKISNFCFHVFTRVWAVSRYAAHLSNTVHYRKHLCFQLVAIVSSPSHGSLHRK